MNTEKCNKDFYLRLIKNKIDLQAKILLYDCSAFKQLKIKLKGTKDISVKIIHFLGNFLN
jgi:hypothetical protein